MVGTLKRVKLRHGAKFRRNWSNSGRDMAIFRFFKMAAAAILDFEIFEILTVETLSTVKLCHYVKFRRNRSNCGRDIAIFRFSKMAAAAISNF